MTASQVLPRVQPVGDSGVMLRYGDHVDEAYLARVQIADQTISAANLPGVTELVPAFTSLFVGYDPLVTDYQSVVDALTPLLANMGETLQTSPNLWEVPVCYDSDFGPDMGQVASQTGLSEDDVVNAHLSGDYEVAMLGFAPGLAYLSGVPKPLQVPRKPVPLRDVPAGSVIIAGPQSLVTTLKMPTGWWIIGRSSFRFLRQEDENPFPLKVKDKLRFVRMSRDDYEKQSGGTA